MVSDLARIRAHTFKYRDGLGIPSAIVQIHDGSDPSHCLSPSFGRRDVLKFGGVALGSSIAGCSSFQTSASDGVRIVRASTINTVDEDIDIAIHLLDGDETAYWQIVRADADPPVYGQAE